MKKDAITIVVMYPWLFGLCVPFPGLFSFGRENVSLWIRIIDS